MMADPASRDTRRPERFALENIRRPGPHVPARRLHAAGVNAASELRQHRRIGGVAASASLRLTPGYFQIEIVRLAARQNRGLLAIFRAADLVRSPGAPFHERRAFMQRHDRGIIAAGVPARTLLPRGWCFWPRQADCGSVPEAPGPLRG